MPIEQSDFLMNVSYDPSTLQATVTMKDGGQYIHPYVYPSDIEQWAKAPSKGSYYARFIKGLHPATRLIDKTVGPPVSKKT